MEAGIVGSPSGLRLHSCIPRFEILSPARATLEDRAPIRAAFEELSSIGATSGDTSQTRAKVADPSSRCREGKGGIWRLCNFQCKKFVGGKLWSLGGSLLVDGCGIALVDGAYRI